VQMRIGASYQEKCSWASTTWACMWCRALLGGCIKAIGSKVMVDRLLPEDGEVQSHSTGIEIDEQVGELDRPQRCETIKQNLPRTNQVLAVVRLSRQVGDVDDSSVIVLATNHPMWFSSSVRIVALPEHLRLG
jgi:hypothetical protein